MAACLSGCTTHQALPQQLVVLLAVKAGWQECRQLPPLPGLSRLLRTAEQLPLLRQFPNIIRHQVQLAGMMLFRLLMLLAAMAMPPGLEVVWQQRRQQQCQQRGLLGRQLQLLPMQQTQLLLPPPLLMPSGSAMCCCGAATCTCPPR
jgi:hypothetical protein